MKFETERSRQCFIPMTTQYVMKCLLLKTFLWLFSLLVIRVSSGLIPESCSVIVLIVCVVEASADYYDDYLSESYENYDGHFQEKQEDPLAKLKRKLSMTNNHFRST